MKYFGKSIFVVLLLLVIATDSFAGGGNRTGTAGASQLLIPVGTTGLALAGSGIATTEGLDAIYWNPAGVAKNTNSTLVGFSHMNYIADIGVDNAAAATTVPGFGTIALNIKSISVDPIPVTTAKYPDGTGQTYKPQFITTGLTYSRVLTDRIAVGATATYISESLGDASASGVAFNIGLIYDNLADIDGLSFGVTVKNLGPQMKYDGEALNITATNTDLVRSTGTYRIQTASFELPSTFELGLGYKPYVDKSNSVSVAATFTNNNFSGDEYKFGLEYSYIKTFYLRAGYSTSPKSQSEDYIYGFTCGAGINYAMESLTVSIGYAYRDVKYFDANHVFEVSLGF
jgi:hypothetical protein